MPVLVASCLLFSSHSRLPHGNFILILQHWLPAAPFQLSLEPPPDSPLLIYNPEQHLPQQSPSCDSFLLSVLPGSFPLPGVDVLCPSLPALHSSCAPPRNSWWGGGNMTGHWKKLCSNTNTFGTKYTEFGQESCGPDPISIEVNGSLCSDFSGCWIRLWWLVTNVLFIVYFIMQISTEEHDPEKYKVLIFQYSFPTPGNSNLTKILF